MRLCAKCSKENPDDVQICRFCGWNLNWKVKITGGPHHHCSVGRDDKDKAKLPPHREEMD